ncbi:helix-turn-helix transcriptional regulator [Daejeonella sp. H1SJ63]|uniref:helix-turn-helix domain-containing protein n=1 Tax=Daejeonella sp. H1SJ63 TaxID=3034145 RepID=UPI0023EDF8F1|nr:helix-turn-helix transcriptional regulator [Daejeonella sp. H1SJ63]
MDTLDLAATLRTYREEKGLNMRDMAERLYMSKSAYDRLEKGSTKPSYEGIQRIFKLLHIQADTIREIDSKGRLPGTITYLKRHLLYGSISTDIALNCIKDLAEALKCRPLFEWVRLETNGYWTGKHPIPDYRMFKPSYDIEYEQDGMKYFMSLPTGFLDSPEESCCIHWELPINESDENWVSSRGKIIFLKENVKGILALKLKEVYGPDLHLIRAAGWVSAQYLQKVLLAVQEIMLRFLLYLETEFGPDADIDELSAHKYQIGIHFRNVLDTVGFAGHLDLPVKPEKQEEIEIIQGDEDRFMDWLTQHDISLYEMDEFYTLREAFEKKPAPKGIVPPEMYAWAKKVNSSNWQFRADEEKLIQGLERFYGVAG